MTDDIEEIRKAWQAWERVFAPMLPVYNSDTGVLFWLDEPKPKKFIPAEDSPEDGA